MNEQAYKDYQLGMKYADIANKYEVSINTVKSWKRRFGWERPHTKKSVQKVQRSVQVQKQAIEGNFENIRKSLLQQLARNGTTEAHYEDLVFDYLKMWKVKNDLIDDIEKRGVQVKYQNGKDQHGYKKNDSIAELMKCNAQMLKILSELGLKAVVEVDDDDEI